jgi:hypothetical protein
MDVTVDAGGSGSAARVVAAAPVPAAAAGPAPAPTAASAERSESDAAFPFSRLPADVKLRVIAALAGCPGAASTDDSGGDGSGSGSAREGPAGAVAPAVEQAPGASGSGEPDPSPWAPRRYQRPSRAAAPAALVCREWRHLSRALVSELALSPQGAAALSRHAGCAAGPGLAAFPGLRRLTLAPTVRDADARRILLSLAVPEFPFCAGSGSDSDGGGSACGARGSDGAGGGGGGGRGMEGLGGRGLVELVGRGARSFSPALSAAALLPALPAGLAGLTRLQISAAPADLYQPGYDSAPWGRPHPNAYGRDGLGDGGGDPGVELAQALDQLPLLADLALVPAPARSGALRRAAPRLQALRALMVETLDGAGGGVDGRFGVGGCRLAELGKRGARRCALHTAERCCTISLASCPQQALPHAAAGCSVTNTSPSLPLR